MFKQGVDRDIDLDKMVEAIISGDHSALDTVYSLYSSRVYNLSLKYLKNEEDALDNVQDVFIKFWQKRAELRYVDDIDSYIFTIARNTIFSLFRKRAQDQKFRDYIKYVSTSDRSSCSEADYNMLLEEYETIIEQLPPKRKMIFKLSRFEGYSHKEISLKQEISTKTVEDHITKSLAFIKQRAGSLLSTLITLSIVEL